MGLSDMNTQQPSPDIPDADLVARIGKGDPRALRDLHRRYASLVFTVAARVVEPSAAEEVVRDVFRTVWQKHEIFDPTRGAFKSWLCQMARRRALDAQRAPGHAPKADGRRDALDALDALDEVTDDALDADEALWNAHRQTALRDAVDALPDAQRRALSLAYFDELTQDQVAALLRVPPAITKTRSRLAMRRLAPALALLVGAGVVLLLWRRRDLETERDERALVMVTSSDVVALHLAPASGVATETRANFRVRPSGRVGILAASHLPDPQGDERYVGWARCAGVWRRLGELEVGSDGGALLLVEDTALVVGIDALEITRESGIAAEAKEPKGPFVLGWTAP